MFNFLKRKKYPWCEGGCVLKFPGHNRFDFRDFHRGGNGEMYIRAEFVCYQCEQRTTIAIRLPQDFTDRCDQTYPWPWFDAPQDFLDQLRLTTKLKEVK